MVSYSLFYLRERLVSDETDSSLVLRVLREGSVLDVKLKLDTEPIKPEAASIRPADAASELASISRHIQLTSFAVMPSGGVHYAAQLSLRFVD